jgi:hypothetical protein
VNKCRVDGALCSYAGLTACSLQHCRRSLEQPGLTAAENVVGVNKKSPPKLKKESFSTPAESSTRQWINELVLREKLFRFGAASSQHIFVENYRLNDLELRKRIESNWNLAEYDKEDLARHKTFVQNILQKITSVFFTVRVGDPIVSFLNSVFSTCSMLVPGETLHNEKESL